MLKQKRFVCLILAAVLLLSTLAGCSADEPQATEQTPTATTPIATEPSGGDEPTPTDPAGTDADTLRFQYDGSKPVVKGEPVDFVSMITRGPESTVTEKENTIMVYLVGSNLESGTNLPQGGAATADLLEMFDSGVDLSKTNVVIYTGGSLSWQVNIPSDKNVVWELTADPEGFIEPVAATDRAIPMGNAETLAGFLDFAYENYPAKHYGLICWDHGCGPLGGYGNDELFGNDPLYMWELEQGFAQSHFANTRMDFLGFDACLMGDVELAWLAQPYARYLIASQEVEPGCGWDYSFLQALNNGTIEDMLGELLRCYEETTLRLYYPKKPQLTLSWIDLDKLDQVTAAMDTLFNKLAQHLAEGNFNQLSNLRKDTYSFGNKSMGEVSKRLDLVDLGHMARLLNAVCPEEAEALETALSSAVVQSVTNLSYAGGLSMYYPYDSKLRFERQAGDTILFEYNLSEGYRNYMKGYLGYWLYNEPDTQWLAAQQLTVEEEVPEQTTPPTEPATQPTEPATQPTVPATQPTDPVTQPTEPATQPTEPTPPETQVTGDNLVLQLPLEHLDSVSRICYTVLYYHPETECYYPVLHNIPVTPDDQGVVRIPRDPEIYTIISDADGRPEMWPMQHIGTEDGVDFYASLGACLLPSTDVISAGMDPVHIVLSRESAQANPKVYSITSRDASVTATISRQEVDVARWGVASFSPIFVVPTQDASGQLLPINQWQQEDWFYMQMKNYDDFFYFSTAPLSQQEGEYHCLVTVTDTSGNAIGTKMIKMRDAEAVKTQEVATAAGKMVFNLYTNHAELASYSGEDETLEIPAQVEGLPVSVICAEAVSGYNLKSVTLPDSVTHIEQDAFSGLYQLESVKLPANLQAVELNAFAYTSLKEISLGEHVTRIGDNAFAGTDITSVVLPAGLIRLGERAFANCQNLTQIMIIGSSKYISVDGVLFSADGKELVAFPVGRAGSYTVPAGTEKIGPAAFNGAKQLTEVVFPEGLTVIDRLAFQDTMNLAALTFPESLHTIGEAAFGCTIGNEPTVVIPELHISKNITTVGTSAFRGYLIGAFSVDAENTEYSSANGCLLNKSGTRLYQAPHGHTGLLEVPFGVSLIDWRAFDFCNGITEIIVPDTVVLIDNAAGVPKSLTKITLGKGLITWENLHKYENTVTVEIHPDNPNYTVVDGNIYSKDMKILYCYRGTGEEFRIPDSVEQLHPNAFSQYGLPVVKLYIGANVQTIPANCFQYLKSLTQIHCPAGSAAEAYAKEHGLTVVTE